MVDAGPAGRPLTLYSEGTRIAAEIFTPAHAAPAAGYPALLLCHGWGGLKSQLVPFALAFARVGFVVMTFDYRGWGESDGRIIPLRDSPRLIKAGERTLKVRVLREVVDPVDQTTDVANCLSALMAEPGVDAARIGIWGTSYGGGNAVYAAGHDERIAAVVAQIGGFDYPPHLRGQARARAAAKARGELDPAVPQQGIDAAPGLRGTPDIARMASQSRLAAAANIRVPTLIMDAEHEELMDRRDHGLAAYEIIRQHAACEYLTFPCGHYAVYDQFFGESVAKATDWFSRHLRR